MKTSAHVIVGAMIMLLAGSLIGTTAYARGHGGHGGRVGIGLWLGPGWWGPLYYPSYYPYYQEPPIIIQQQPDVYALPAPQEEQPSYWYYCKNPQGYYPYVKQCPNGWMKVVPTPPPPQALPPE